MCLEIVIGPSICLPLVVDGIVSNLNSKCFSTLHQPGSTEGRTLCSGDHGCWPVWFFRPCAGSRLFGSWCGVHISCCRGYHCWPTVDDRVGVTAMIEHRVTTSMTKIALN